MCVPISVSESERFDSVQFVTKSSNVVFRRLSVERGVDTGAALEPEVSKGFVSVDVFSIRFN